MIPSSPASRPLIVNVVELSGSQTPVLSPPATRPLIMMTQTVTAGCDMCHSRNLDIFLFGRGPEFVVDAGATAEVGERWSRWGVIVFPFRAR